VWKDKIGQKKEKKKKKERSTSSTKWGSQMTGGEKNGHITGKPRPGETMRIEGRRAVPRLRPGEKEQGPKGINS